MTKKHQLILGFLLFFSALNAQQPVPTFSLVQLLDSAVQQNYMLQSNEKQTAIKKTEIELLKINYLPRFTASANLSYWKWLMPNKAKILGNTLSDVYTDLTAYQTIYDWGKTKIQKQSVEEEIQLNADVRRQLKSTIIWGVTDAYFETLKSIAEISVHQNVLKQLKSHLDYVENLYKIGKVSNIDLLKVNVQLSVEEKALQKAENSLQSQYIKLKMLCNIEEQHSIKLSDTSDALFYAWEKRLFPLQESMDEALQNHPILAVDERKIKMEAKQKELYRLTNRPELFSFGVANWEDGYLPFGSHFNYNIGVGVRYTLPYFGGSGFKTKMSQSDLRMEQLGIEQKQAMLEIKKEIEATLNDLMGKKEEIASNKKINKLAEETISNAWVTYQVGKGSIVDVLDAESILTESTISQKKAELSLLQTIAKLHYLKGNDTNPF